MFWRGGRPLESMYILGDGEGFNGWNRCNYLCQKDYFRLS